MLIFFSHNYSNARVNRVHFSKASTSKWISHRVKELPDVPGLNENYDLIIDALFSFSFAPQREKLEEVKNFSNV